MSSSGHGDDLALARQGDGAAYSRLIRLHQHRVFRHLAHMTGSREEALELAQEAFLKAWQALPQWRPDAQFGTWLMRIASNLALDVLRRRKTVRFVPLEEDYDAPGAGPGPEAQLEVKERMAVLDAALSRLSAEQREIVLLREVEGMSYEELGTVLGLDEGTVKSRLARARAALAGAMKKVDA